MKGREGEELPQKEQVRAHLLISGRVQGVGYRAFVEREAVRRALSGWVRNLNDGQVETEVEGDRFSVRAFIDILEVGPMLARVDHVDIQWENPMGRDHVFRIIC